MLGNWTFDKNEMKLGLRYYAVVMSIEKSCIRFNNNRINSLERYDTAQNYKVLHKAFVPT
jgi:hypothetical protein